MIMASLSQMPQSMATLFSFYATYTGVIMLLRSIANDLFPKPLRSYLCSKFNYLFTPLSTNATLIIDQYINNMSPNQFYDAAEIYLRTKISPQAERLKVSKTYRQKSFSITVEKGEQIHDVFENIQLKWQFSCEHHENNNHHHHHHQYSNEKLHFELTFPKKHKDTIMSRYLSHVLVQANEIKEREKVVKLYNRECPHDEDDFGGGAMWGCISLDHPATFDKLAMDPETKKMILEDLDRFVKRKEFYKRVGKAWKRGYLLYGPPGTGKSSLIAAIANYLRFDIYDLDLASIYSNSDLRRILLSTSNRSILIIEDIDCSSGVQVRQHGNGGSSTKLTLSGILNFIDGLWSSCGDERIIVFTTNHKDRIDPALLRPGRMDVHINMSYCSFSGFKLLASNYLGIEDNNVHHSLFGEIEGLIQTIEVTPAEVAEELMKSDDADVALEGFVHFLKRKRVEADDQVLLMKESDHDHDHDHQVIMKGDQGSGTDGVLKQLKKNGVARKSWKSNRRMIRVRRNRPR